MDDLPFEIITLIFEHLPDDFHLCTCTLVSHRFYIAATRLLWRSLTLRNDTTRHPLVPLATASPPSASLHSLSIRVRKLTLMDWTGTDDQWLLILTHLGPFLEELQLCNTIHLTDVSMIHLPCHVPQLVCLDLKNCPPTITEQAIHAVGQHCHRLRRLSLVNCCGVAGSGTFSTLDGSGLTHLTLGLPYSGLRTKQAAMDMTRMTRLTHLTLSAAPMYFYERLLSLQRDAWTHLVMLTIEGYRDNTTTATVKWMSAFLASHPGLKQLQLERGHVSDRTLDAIADLHPPASMKWVNVSENNGAISDHGVRRLVQHCPRLESLSMDGCGIKADAFPEIDALEVNGKYVDHLNQRAIHKIRATR